MNFIKFFLFGAWCDDTSKRNLQSTFYAASQVSAVRRCIRLDLFFYFFINGYIDKHLDHYETLNVSFKRESRNRGAKVTTKKKNFIDKRLKIIAIEQNILKRSYKYLFKQYFPGPYVYVPPSGARSTRVTEIKYSLKLLSTLQWS